MKQDYRIDTVNFQQPAYFRLKDGLQYLLALCFILITLTATAQIKSSIRFNSKELTPDRASKKNKLIFDLGKLLDFSRGSISFRICPEWYGSSDLHVPLATLNLNGSTIKLEKGLWKKSIHLILSNGKPAGHAYSEIADWIPGQWHYITATWSKDKLCLYQDGVYKTKIRIPVKPGWLPSGPAPAKLIIEGKKTTVSNVTLSNRVLSADEVAAQFKKSSGIWTEIKLPERPWRIVYKGEKPEITVHNSTDKEISGKLHFRLIDFTDPGRRELVNQTVDTIVQPGKSSSQKVNLPKCGLLQLTVEFTSNGKIMGQNNKVFGVGPKPPDIKTLTDSPFGYGASTNDAADLPLAGIKCFRGWGGDCSWSPGNLTWEQVEPAKDTWRWEKNDRRARIQHKLGLNTLWLLGSCSKWASTAPENTKLYWLYKPRIDDWRKYVETIVGHYRGKVTYWEVWNEPNSGFCVWDKEKKQTLEDPYVTDDLVEVHRVAYEAARKVNPEARIVGPCFQGFAVAFLNRVINAGILKYLDVISWHIYTHPKSPEEADLENRLNAMVGMIRKAGGKQPIWNTETGYFTPPRRQTYPMSKAELEKRWKRKDRAYRWPNDAWPIRAIDEWTVAEYMVRFYLINLACGVEKVFWFNWEVSDHCWQATEVSGSPYLHVLAYNVMSTELTGLPFIKKINAANKANYLYLFGNSGRQILTAWHSGAGNSRVVLQLNPAIRQVTAVDLYGNRKTLVPKDGSLVLELNGSPQYLKGIGTEVSCTNTLVLEIPETVDSSVPVKVKTVIKNREGAELHGSLSYELPPQWTIKPDSTTVSVANRMTKTYEGILRIPPTVEAGEYALRAVVKTDNEKTISIRKTVQVYKPVPCCRVEKPVQVDGVFDEWEDIPDTIALNQRSQVIIGLRDAGSAIADEKDLWKKPADLNAAAKLAWDEKNFYLAVRVNNRRGKVFPANVPYHGDCVELFFDSKGSLKGKRTVFDKFCQQWFVQPLDNGKVSGLGKNSFGMVRSAWRQRGDGYDIELAIPWKNFNPFIPATGRVFGFDLAVDDVGRQLKGVKGPDKTRLMLTWSGKNDNYCNPARYGRVRLTGSNIQDKSVRKTIKSADSQAPPSPRKIPPGKSSDGNLLANPGFENGRRGWLVWQYARGVTIAVVDKGAHSGDMCLEIKKKKARWGGVLAPVNWEDGKTYQVSAWLKIAGNKTLPRPLYFTVIYKTKDGKLKQNAIDLKTVKTDPETGWTKLSGTFTFNAANGIKPDKNNGFMLPTGSGDNDTFYLDDVKISILE